MRTPFDCNEVAGFVDAYVDGEFSPEDRGALEQHLGACPDCTRRVRARATFKTSLRVAAKADAQPVPDTLRASIGAALDAESQTERRRRIVGAAWLAVPAMAAMGLLLGFNWARPSHSPVVADAVSRHARNLPVEVRGDEQAVRTWFADKVGFNVRPPRLSNAALVGARLASVRDRDAAYFIYRVGNEKVSVLVFDPAGMPLVAPERRQVGDKDVWLDAQSGYRVAMFRDRNVGYAITSDLDDASMLQLVSEAVNR